jgi:hypothetical protein
MKTSTDAVQRPPSSLTVTADLPVCAPLEQRGEFGPDVAGVRGDASAVERRREVCPAVAGVCGDTDASSDENRSAQASLPAVRAPDVSPDTRSDQKALPSAKAPDGSLPTRSAAAAVDDVPPSP